MSILQQEKKLYGSEIKLISQIDDCSVYKYENSEGYGIMTSYQVFPGIELLYNDFNMVNCFHNERCCSDVMEINHCRQGRFECDFQNASCVYLEEGDLSANMLSNRTKNSCFPLGYYNGVSIVIDIEKASKSISSVFNDISINIYELKYKLCPDNRCFIMRAKDSIEHIFSELYTVPDKIKKGYFKLKVLELLLFLSATDISNNLSMKQYFYRNQVDIIKKIKEYMIKNLEYRYTLDELSEYFGISLTTMKLCFKGVYGTSIYAFMRSYRMQVAGTLLINSCDSISSIAGKVGYANSSKFSAAFKEIKGLSPLEYRKSKCLNRASSDCLE